MTKRSLAAAGVVLALLLASAVPASAATRLAAPGAIGANPCNPAPCGLALAVSGANNGDQVTLAPGAYSVAGDLVISKAIEVGGTPGATTSVVTEEGVRVENLAALLHDVQLSLAAPAMAYALGQEAGTVERVYVDGTNGLACSMESGVMRDSACFEGLMVNSGEPGNHEAILRNVTADPVGFGAFGGGKLIASAVNVMALPSSSPSSSKSGVLMNVSAGSSAVVTLTNSNFNSVDTTLSSGSDFTYTAPGTNGNQTALPLLVNAAAGDFRQLPGSPTIDAGVPEVLIDPFDLAGAPRVQGPCGVAPVVDIGAYEFAFPACPATGGGGTGGAAGSGGSKPVSTSKRGGKGAGKRDDSKGQSAVALRFGKPRLHPARGTATLPVVVAAAGLVKLGGKGVVARQLRAKGAETVKLVVKAKGRKAVRLRSHGTVKLRPTVTFVGRGGPPATISRPLKLKLRPAP